MRYWPYRTRRHGRKSGAQHGEQRVHRCCVQPHHGRSRRNSRPGSAKGKNILPARTLEEFVGALERPRKAMIMVKAGAPVDAVIDGTRAAAGKGGRDHRRRQLAVHRHPAALQGARGEGHPFRGLSASPAARRARSRALDHARRPGEVVGDRRAYFHEDRRAGGWRALLPLHGAGRRGPLRKDGPQRHRVRRHAVDLRGLRHSQGSAEAWAPDELAEIFTSWNEGELNSYLIEITSLIFKKKRPRKPASRWSM